MSPSTNHDVIDLSRDPVALAHWNPADWINKGKKYPQSKNGAEVPCAVLAGRQQVLALQPKDRKLLPDPRLSIDDFLKLDLPTQSTAPVYLQANRWFHTGEPNEGLENIQTRPLPSPKVLEDLHKAFGQQWFDGARSIADPRYKKSRLPLNVLTYWTEMSYAVSKQAIWNKADEWLNRHGGKGAVKAADEARTLMGTLEWSGSIQTLGIASPVDTLAQLLGDVKLDDEVINMACAYLAQKARLDKKHATATLVASLQLQMRIEEAYRAKTWGDSEGTVLRRYRESIVEGGRDTLLMPAFVNQNHWVLFEIDFIKKTLRCGDSRQWLGGSVKKESQKILEWLRHDFGSKFTDEGDTLPHGKQPALDGVNCGVFTINTLAHRLFGDELINKKTQHAERMRYFSLLVKAHNHDILTRNEPPALNYVRLSEQQVSLLLDHNFRHEIPEEALEMPPSPQGSITSESNSSATSQPTASPPHALPAFSEPDEGRELSIPLTAEIRARVDEDEDADVASSAMDIDSVPGDATDTEICASSHREGFTASDVPIDDDATRALKRNHSPVSATSASSVSTAKRPRLDHTPLTSSESEVLGVVGISKSAKAYQKKKQAMRDGTLTVSEEYIARFKNKALEWDSWAEFTFGEKWKIRHSKCGTWRTMKVAGDLTRFTEHVESCAGPKKNASRGATAKTSMLMSDPSDAGSIDKFIKKGSRRTEDSDKLKSQPRAQPSNMRSETLDAMAKRLGWSTSKKETDHTSALTQKDDVTTLKTMVDKKSPNMRSVPCGGITKAHAPRVARYLRRPIGTGGGGPSRTVIANELYGKAFGQLSPEQKEHVKNRQQHERTWRVDHLSERIFAVSCLKTITISVSQPTSTNSPPPLCDSCSRVLHSKAFKNAINVKVPDGHNFKFSNDEYIPTEAGKIYAKYRGLGALVEDTESEESIFTRFAVAVQEGKFAQEDVFLDLVRAMALKADRQERGVGLQNFQYGPALREFANMCAILSPEVYRRLGKHFQLPDIRTLKYEQAKAPRFPIGICPKTFEIAEAYVKGLHYNGPVALSCDDTKLHPAYRTYWDSNAQSWMLVGGADKTYAVANPDELQDLLQSLPKGNKATKIRLWTMLVPCPGIPPLVLAAKAIPNSLNAQELVGFLREILDGLAAKGIHAVSYSCDGTETERAVQRAIIEGADSTFKYTIRHPAPGLPDLVIVIARIHGHLIVMIQDAKHARKTYRNNVFSGARALVLGNYVAIYSYARDLAYCSNPPLYVRDVEKLDRQDDNAATRLFSSAVMKCISEEFPERIGMLVYLFVFGDLVDAYQNRSISHIERIKMVLRARFFLDAWKQYLRAAGYSEARYFLSREAADISKILIDGLIGLVIVYRDHVDGKIQPLLPWLHSTEVCEHLFGECRKIIKDFTYLDFIFMVPRLSILVRSVIRFMQTLDAKKTASGYAHTYYDSDGVDIALLSCFPTDEEIASASKEAWDEVSNLLELLGITPSDLMAASVDSSKTLHLPSISTWYASPASEGFPMSDSLVATDESDVSDDEFSDDSDVDDTDAMQLEQLIEAQETAPISKHSTDERLFSLTCAAVALSLDETNKAQNTEVVSEQDIERHLREDASLLHQTLDSISLPPLQLPAEPMRPFDRIVQGDDYDFSALIAIRSSHQTKRATTGVRTRHSVPENTNGGSPSPLANTRRKLIAEMHAVLREAEEGLAIGTGLERQVRTQGRSAVETTGNSFNAALVANQRANKHIQQRLKAFSEQRVPRALELGDALIGVHNSSQPNHNTMTAGVYGIVVHENRLLVGTVLTFYSPGGGKTAVHGWQAETTSIGSVSYIVLRTYEHAFLHKFRAVHHNRVALQTHGFLHTHSDRFLRTLPGSQTLLTDGRTLELNPEAYKIFEDLASPRSLAAILAAEVELDKLRRRGREVV